MLKILILILIILFFFIIYYSLSLDRKRYSSKNFDVKIINNFLNNDEINKILNEYNNFKPSLIVSNNGLNKSNYRTSKSCIINKNTDIYNLIKNKINNLGLQSYNIENLQLTKYNKGDFYKSHHDYFDEEVQIEKKYIENYGQRLKTIFVYLLPALKGGGTRFNKLNKTFNLKKGDALYWDNCYKRNNKYIYIDKSEHEGLPVLEGEKIGLNIWLLD